MRHRVYGRHLSRSKNERTALFRSLVRELFLHESIKTTAPKAKAVKGLVDTIIVKGKKNDSASQRWLLSFLVKPELVKRVVEDIAPRYTDRPSGFTTMVRLGMRQGDGALLVKMSLLDGSAKKGKKSVKADDQEVVEAADAVLSETSEATEEKVEDKPKKAPRARKAAAK